LFAIMALLVIVALESSLAIVGALKSKRNRVNPKSVYNFVTPEGVLNTRPWKMQQI
jgi:hypothetical protein